MGMYLAKTSLIIVLIVAIQACTLGPDYTRPDMNTPSEFIETESDESAFANMEWWALFEDAHLKTHIETALEANKDLNIALSRIEEARKLVTVVRSDQFPTIDATGGAGRGRESREIFPDADTEDNYCLLYTSDAADD